MDQGRRVGHPEEHKEAIERCQNPRIISIIFIRLWMSVSSFIKLCSMHAKAEISVQDFGEANGLILVERPISSIVHSATNDK